ncbi:hypothetical protein [Mycoplasma sp. 3341]|uniref:hypothetical protein n=1 Tax=Mycoplasma sp. 3341 TaxID=3447506 RepID=UPI003F658242
MKNKLLNSMIALGTGTAAAVGLTTALLLVKQSSVEEVNYAKNNNIYQAMEDEIKKTQVELAENKNLSDDNKQKISDLVQRASEFVKQKILMLRKCIVLKMNYPSR